MLLKTLKLNKKGSSLLELALIVGLLSVLILSAYLIINPADSYARARDERRLTDLQTLDRAVNEYFLDNDAYPGAENTNLLSTSAPSGIPESASTGWFGTDMSEYFVKTPIDPLNDLSYYYIYKHNGSSYEINARLENSLEIMLDDGGNSTDYYEIGNNLSVF